MKTTENISLGGYAFTIEADAYKELEAYLKEIRIGFSTDPSADEIIADIEERIAELLKEQTVPGMVVNMAMIYGIRKRIGNPKELTNEEVETVKEDSQSSPEPEPQPQPKPQPQQKKADRKSVKNRRLYRDMVGRVFGGVCSGIGAYFGIDAVLIRIIFLILFMIGLIGISDGPHILFSILLYCCLWIAMPAARTDEQKREMHGRPTDLKDYKDKNFDFDKEIKDISQSPGGRTLRRAGGVFIGILLLIWGLGGLLGGIFIPSMPELIDNQIADHIFQWGGLDAEEQLIAELLGGTTFWGLVLMMVGIGCIGIIYGGIMLLFDLNPPKWKPGLVIFIAWIISIFAIAAYTVKVVADALPGLFL